MLVQGTLLVAVQAQPAAADTVTLPVPPAAEKLRVSGLIENDGAQGVTMATAQMEKWPTTLLKRTMSGTPAVGWPLASSLCTATQPPSVGTAPPVQIGKA